MTTARLELAWTANGSDEVQETLVTCSHLTACAAPATSWEALKSGSQVHR